MVAEQSQRRRHLIGWETPNLCGSSYPYLVMRCWKAVIRCCFFCVLALKTFKYLFPLWCSHQFFSPAVKFKWRFLLGDRLKRGKSEKRKMQRGTMGNLGGRGGMGRGKKGAWPKGWDVGLKTRRETPAFGPTFVCLSTSQWIFYGLAALRESVLKVVVVNTRGLKRVLLKHLIIFPFSTSCCAPFVCETKPCWWKWKTLVQNEKPASDKANDFYANYSPLSSSLSEGIGQHLICMHVNS